MFDKTRYIELIEKYLNNSCTKEEFDELCELLKGSENFEYLKDSDLLYKFFDLMEPETIDSKLSNELYQNIMVSAVRKNKTLGKLSIKRIIKIAAVFVGVIGAGFFLKNYIGNSTKTNLYENHVVLEQADGTKLILEEIKDSAIVSTTGDTIQFKGDGYLKYPDSNKSVGSNTIHVPNGKTFMVELADKTLVHLNSGSTITYPLSFNGVTKRSIQLTGEAYFDVVTNKDKPFEVTTERLGVRVLGTEFNISSYKEDDQIKVVLVEGSVAMRDLEGETTPGEMITLKPGYMGSFNREQHQIDVLKVNVADYVSWRDNQLIFRNMPLVNIFTKLERHFDIQIEIENESILGEVLNANFGEEPIDNIMSYLSEIYDFEYKINEEKVNIYKK